MGLGSTAKKLQTLADTAEKLYARMNEIRDQLVETRQTVSESRERLARVETELAEQRAILEAVAREQGVDLDAVTAEIHIAEAEDEAEASTGDGVTADGAGGTDAAASPTEDA
jgi:septal ring factor EnvC (AmiA/AmiB activator)